MTSGKNSVTSGLTSSQIDLQAQLAIRLTIVLAKGGSAELIQSIVEQANEAGLDGQRMLKDCQRANELVLTSSTKGIDNGRLIERAKERKSNLDWWHQAMSILQKLFGGKTNGDALANCYLAMARDEIIGLHNMMNAEAAAKGGKHLFSKEYAAAWVTFRDDPNIDNARSLLEVAPPLAGYFESCSPGGSTYTAKTYLRKHGLK